MKSPEGMKGTKYVRLHKSLYGLKQSGKAWYAKLDAVLSSLDFHKSECDSCIYIHNTRQLVIGVYVDDLIICGLKIQHVEEIKSKLSSYFPIKDLKEIGTIIGWKISRDRENRVLQISQTHYIMDKIRSFGLEDAKPYTSPLEGYKGVLPADEDEPLSDESAYSNAVGSLGYAANGTRPDVSFATSQLASHNSAPVQRHWNSICRVLRYLKGTKDYCIKYNYGPLASSISPDKKAVLFSDSDYASDVTTRRSVSGYILMLGDDPVCWQSRRQKSVATSTAEAEYVAIYEALKQAVWFNRFIKELRASEELLEYGGTITLTDNQSALALAKGTNSAKTKHIDVAYHYRRECIANGDIKLDYTPTTDMQADILTKPLSHSKLNPIIQKIFSL